jgi:hypothetical protein
MGCADYLSPDKISGIEEREHGISAQLHRIQSEKGGCDGGVTIHFFTCTPEFLRRRALPASLGPYLSRLVKRRALSTSTITPIRNSAAI